LQLQKEEYISVAKSSERFHHNGCPFLTITVLKPYPINIQEISRGNTKPEIHKTERDILRWIKRQKTEDGQIKINVKKIAKQLGIIRTSCVSRCIDRLVEKGYLESGIDSRVKIIP
jgi:DNA-binding MarR family transcriptional regulator